MRSRLMEMADNNWLGMSTFNDSSDLFDDSFDEEDYLTSLAITASRDMDVSINTYERDATDENSKKQQSQHKEASASAARNDTIDVTETFTCPFCELNEESVYSIESHVAAAHPEMMVDESKAGPNSHCKSLRFGQSEGFHSLNGDEDDDKSTPICPYCDIRFESEINVLEHIDSVHKEELLGISASSSGTVECPICDVQFTSGAELEDHVQWHFPTSDSYNLPYKSLRSCPFCDFRNEDYALLVSHVESHFDPHHAPGPSKNRKPPLPSGSTASYSRVDDNSDSTAPSSRNDHNSQSQRKPKAARGRNTYQQQYRQNLERSVLNGHISPGEYHEMMSEMRRSHQLGTDEGHSKVEGLYENIAATYHRMHLHEPNLILCDPTDYYCGSYGDKGWGCGYRNFQMLISCLARIPMYAERLFPDGEIQVPSVCKLQQIIEGAWQKGFDHEGCVQLGAKLVNTRKWIGATEVVATLSSMGIKCILADFHGPTGTGGTHPQLLIWIYNYFSQHSEHKPPLYLQHQGHSRTIAGIENDNGTLKLLMFDPGTPYHRVAHLAHRPIAAKQLRTFRRTLAAFKARQYQVVAVTGILTPIEYEESKLLQSIQVT